MIFSIFCTDQFLTSLAGLWVCSNERAPTTPLQQSIRGIIESPLACALARTRRSLGSYNSVVCLHSLSSLALLFLSVALSYLDFRKHFWSSTLHVLDAIFFLTKGIPPTWQSIPSYKHTKNTVTQNHLGILAAQHDIPSPSLSPSFGLFFHLYLFFLFFGSVPIPFFSRFFNYEKRKFAQSISSLQFQGFAAPPQLLSDTMAHMLSISFRLRHDWALIAIFHRSPADKTTTTHF